YFFGGIGWVSGLMASSGGALSLADMPVGYVVKAVNVLFGFADGVFIFLIARQMGFGRRWTYIASGLFVFNPAVWFSMSVWGQTHVISLFFVLAALWTGDRGGSA